MGDATLLAHAPSARVIHVGAPLDLGVTPRAEPDGSLFWTHERLHRLVMQDPERLAPLFLPERDALEARLLSADDAQSAWNEAREALERWTTQVSARADRDVRPWATRRYWRMRRQPA